MSYVSDVIVQKLHVQKVSHFRLPPKGKSPYHVAIYVPGSKVNSRTVSHKQVNVKHLGQKASTGKKTFKILNLDMKNENH